MSIAVSGHYFVTDTLNDERKQCPSMQHPHIQYPVYVFCSYVNVVQILVYEKKWFELIIILDLLVLSFLFSHEPGQVAVIWSEKLIFITTTIHMAASDVTHMASSSTVTLTLQMNNSAWVIF